MTARPSKRWRRKAEAYRLFALVAEETGFRCDYSDAAASAMFVLESTGKGTVAADNGYAIGKSWLDMQLAMWREDLPLGLVTRDEIPEDLWPLLPDARTSA